MSCVTDAILWVSPGGFRLGGPHWIAFQSGAPVRLLGPAHLALIVEQYYHLTPTDDSGGSVRIGGYLYAFDDMAGREILAYHLHSEVGGAGFPHLHVGHGIVRAEVLERAGLSIAHNALRPEVAGAHLPTAIVSLIDVLRAAIEELGVQPQRRDWRSILR